MSKSFYIKLAWNNIKKNSKSYIPYILTCIGMIIMFYNMCYLLIAKEIGYDDASLRSILGFGTIVTGVFAFIFLSYTNRFLIRQRKKEFGLFNILGMEKRHISRVMLLETLMISTISLVIGVLGGIAISKLLALLLLRIINFDVVFGFEIPINAVLITMGVFILTFTINLIYNILQVHLSKPIELLRGGNVGEKEPKTKWLSAIIGVISLGIGYYLALTIESPLAALSRFFIAVILVILGTHNLFKAGSIALLKSLRKNKNYYYKTNHFISVSGMIYRMKQNAAGLANICILSTAVILTLSTTVSLYVGVEDVLRARYPRNITISGDNISNKDIQEIEDIINQQVAKANLTKEDVYSQRNMSFLTSQEGEKFNIAKEYAGENLALLVFLTVDNYNEIEDQDVSLEEGEAFVYELNGKIPGDKIVLNNFELNIKERLDSFEYEGESTAIIADSHYIVVDSLETIEKIYRSLEDSEDVPELSYYHGFDINADSETQINLTASLKSALDNTEFDLLVEDVEGSRTGFYSTYGGLLFLGIFIGLLFILATVLIIYYKQIAEGFDDKDRFEIMQKVGMSHREIKKAIHSQILTVFFLPLVTAVIHIAIAFPMVTKLLLLFGLTNTPLFAICTAATIIVFVFFYTIIYSMTARTYYKIVQ
ncbi:ABC transporter permease [Irregularibacter muris]|uniref:ABC transporter permease n=1 Tax=Irregularibacter muris TaxID=1796619 RepID=A0AAE3L2N9_9FIRM|nr:ABC transporter permease [Irregularibacter muris]MCR1898919.1 ABC transporter permease [Irregularibacter muris]